MPDSTSRGKTTTMSRPSILLINYEFPPLGGGGGNATQNIAKEMARIGADVKVLTTRYRDQPKQESIDGYHIQRVRTPRRWEDRSSPFEMLMFILMATPAAIALTRTWRPVMSIAFFGLPSGPVAMALKWFRDIPYVVSLRGGDVPGHQPDQLAAMHRVTTPVIQAIWRRAHAVVANSRGLQALAEKSARDHEVQVIPNGVDTTFFAPADPRPCNRSPVLLYAGRISEEKGLDDLVTALAGLRDIDWHMHFVGDGPFMPSLKTCVSQADIEDRVTYTGWTSREQLVAHYQSADLFVFPSRHEGMPNSVLEAMACGLPILATRIAGNEELVEHTTNGHLVPPNSPDTLAKALRTMLEDSAPLPQYGSASRERAANRHSWRITAECYMTQIVGNTAHL